VKIEKVSVKTPKERELRRKLHAMIKKITEDIEGGFKFNTAISGLMELLNHLVDYLNTVPESEWNKHLLREIAEKMVLILSPFAPHMAEELWQDMGMKGLVVEQSWPSYDPEALKVEEVEIAVQINGKIRDRVMIPVDADEETVRKLVLERERVKRYLNGKEPKKFFYIKGRLVNIVV